MKHPLASKTIILQIAMVATILSFPEVREIYCKDARAPVIAAAVATIIMRVWRSNLKGLKVWPLK